MSYRITWRDCVSPAFIVAVDMFRKSLNSLCKERNWTLVSYNPGYYIISAFIRDSFGNFIYVHKWGFDIDANFYAKDYVSDKEIKNWVNSSKILYRCAKNAEDFIGEENNYTVLKDLGDSMQILFNRKPKKRSRKAVYIRFNKKGGKKK